MKRLILGIIIGSILSGTIVYAVTYNAKQINFIPLNTEWKNEGITTVDGALNYLYENKDVKLSFVDSGSSIGSSISSERTITKELDVGKYIIILDEFNTNEKAGTTTSIRLDNEKNSFKLLKSDNIFSAKSYSASTSIGTYYVVINEKGNTIFSGKDVYDFSGGGAGLVYQIYKIN